MIEYYKMAFQKYADFEGRSRRSEYWYFTLGNFLVLIVLGFIGGIISGILDMPVIGAIPYILYALAMIIPSLAVTVRRLHDTNKSGWFLLISLIPFIGSIILLVFYCTEGDRGPNQYGPDPKDPNSTDNVMEHLV